MEKIEALADSIEAELDKFSLADDLRAAAWFAIEAHPGVTASEFGDAAVRLGLHRQGAMNRFNEAKKNLELANA